MVKPLRSLISDARRRRDRHHRLVDGRADFALRPVAQRAVFGWRA
jgi:hypothetical protein